MRKIKSVSHKYLVQPWWQRVKELLGRWCRWFCARLLHLDSLLLRHITCWWRCMYCHCRQTGQEHKSLWHSKKCKSSFKLDSNYKFHYFVLYFITSTWTYCFICSRGAIIASITHSACKDTLVVWTLELPCSTHTSKIKPEWWNLNTIKRWRY